MRPIVIRSSALLLPLEASRYRLPPVRYWRIQPAAVFYETPRGESRRAIPLRDFVSTYFIFVLSFYFAEIDDDKADARARAD